MIISYCESCGKRITKDESNIDLFFRSLSDHYCPECLERLSNASTAEMPAYTEELASPKRTFSSRRLARVLMARRMGIRYHRRSLRSRRLHNRLHRDRIVALTA
jgi:hypothetical protein